MDEIDSVREVLLRACTGMANGPDIMARYDAQSAQLATQAEELKRLREERDGWKASYEADVKQARVEAAEARDQLTKRSAVVEALRKVREVIEDEAQREDEEYDAQVAMAEHDGTGTPGLVPRPAADLLRALDALTTDTGDDEVTH